MGPNYEHARQQAKLAHEKIKAMLHNEFHVGTPEETRWFKEDYIEADKKLASALEDIFIADANASF